MNRKQALEMSRGQCHECTPEAWRGTPMVTGDYDLDQTILHRKNTDLPARLKLYVSRSAYGPKTAYQGYSGGDD